MGKGCMLQAEKAGEKAQRWECGWYIWGTDSYSSGWRQRWEMRLSGDARPVKPPLGVITCWGYWEVLIREITSSLGARNLKQPEVLILTIPCINSHWELNVPSQWWDYSCPFSMATRDGLATKRLPLNVNSAQWDGSLKEIFHLGPLLVDYNICHYPI